jgi:hypothetical protein
MTLLCLPKNSAAAKAPFVDGLYREHGEAGLYTPHACSKKVSKKLNSNLQSKIIELKKDDPQRGFRRISDIMRRFFLLQASLDTVRKTLHGANLIEPPPKKRRKNIQKPRCFELNFTPPE